VPADWALILSDVSATTNFPLLFITSATRDGASSNVADYNSFVQTRAKTGHAGTSDACGDLFKVVGSTALVKARQNTDSESTDTDAAIYWLDNGEKVADNYTDFYDGSWDGDKMEANENGGDMASSSIYFRGYNDDGNCLSGYEFGKGQIAISTVSSALWDSRAGTGTSSCDQ